MSEIFEFGLLELRKALDSKELSSVEITTAFLERIDTYAELNSFTQIFPDHALECAKKADQKSKKSHGMLLHGIPIAVKDIIATSFAKTTCGSKMLKDYTSPYSATAVEKLLESGAVILGKTNLDEFAMGSSNENSCFGPVKNPWNYDHVPGGSSGGSAAAVAGRLVPAALGTDTGGSVRQPASYCGICGLKPTYGRVSRWGLVAFASSLDQIGSLALSAEDMALMLGVISGYDQRDSTSSQEEVPDFSGNLKPDVKGLKLGVPSEYFIEGLDEDVQLGVQSAIKTFKDLGAQIVDISLPHTEEAVAAYYIIAPAEASSNLARFDGVRYGHRAAEYEDLLDMYRRSRSEAFGAEVKRRILVGTYVLSTGYYDAYYKQAQKVRSLIADDFKLAFSKDCDLIICPTAPTTAFRLGEMLDDPLKMYLNDVFTVPVNLAGLPAISIPCGLSSAGLPIGMQLIGRAWDEQLLLNSAFAYQSATDWHKKMPPGIIAS